MELIEVLLKMETVGDLRNTVLDGNLDFLTDSMQPSPNYFVHLFVFIRHRQCKIYEFVCLAMFKFKL